MACGLEAQNRITELQSGHKGLLSDGEVTEGSRLDHCPSLYPSRLLLSTLLDLLDLYQFFIHSTWKPGITWYLFLLEILVWTHQFHSLLKVWSSQKFWLFHRIFSVSFVLNSMVFTSHFFLWEHFSTFSKFYLYNTVLSTIATMLCYILTSSFNWKFVLTSFFLFLPTFYSFYEFIFLTIYVFTYLFLKIPHINDNTLY